MDVRKNQMEINVLVLFFIFPELISTPHFGIDPSELGSNHYSGQWACSSTFFVKDTDILYATSSTKCYKTVGEWLVFHLGSSNTAKPRLEDSEASEK